MLLNSLRENNTFLLYLGEKYVGKSFKDINFVSLDLFGYLAGKICVWGESSGLFQCRYFVSFISCRHYFFGFYFDLLFFHHIFTNYCLNIPNIKKTK